MRERERDDDIHRREEKVGFTRREIVLCRDGTWVLERSENGKDFKIFFSFFFSSFFLSFLYASSVSSRLQIDWKRHQMKKWRRKEEGVRAPGNGKNCLDGKNCLREEKGFERDEKVKQSWISKRGPLVLLLLDISPSLFLLSFPLSNVSLLSWMFKEAWTLKSIHLHQYPLYFLSLSLSFRTCIYLPLS